jgi:hypothetical protein
MAERRMFAKTIVDSDAFLDMSLSTQALYFHLSMRADDDGFINNPKKIARMIGSNDDEFKILIAKKFILTFESGVIVIKHWRIHNYIQKDRYKKTNYHEEMALLNIEENNGYTLDTENLQFGDSGKVRIELGKDSIEEKKKKPASKLAYPTLEELKAYIEEKQYSIDANYFFEYFTTSNWIDSKGNKVKNWKQKLITWNNHSNKANSKPNKEWGDNYGNSNLEWK